MYVAIKHSSWAVDPFTAKWPEYTKYCVKKIVLQYTVKYKIILLRGCNSDTIYDLWVGYGYYYVKSNSPIFQIYQNMSYLFLVRN